MTDKEYKKLKSYNWHTLEKGDPIRLTHPFEKGRITRIGIKMTQKDGTKGVLVGNIFYRLKDIEVVKEDE